MRFRFRDKPIRAFTAHYGDNSYEETERVLQPGADEGSEKKSEPVEDELTPIQKFAAAAKERWEKGNITNNSAPSLLQEEYEQKATADKAFTPIQKFVQASQARWGVTRTIDMRGMTPMQRFQAGSEATRYKRWGSAGSPTGKVGQ